MSITITTKPFRSGNSQAIRLPKDMAYPDDTELVLVRSGDVLTVYPVRASKAEMLEALRRLPAPPEIEVRDTEEIPEREGL